MKNSKQHLKSEKDLLKKEKIRSKIRSIEDKTILKLTPKKSK